jgi:Restriction endonuclease NaeI
VERTFIGLKVEHRLRHLLRVPRGKHDLVIGGMDVDVKNTIGNSWMIGPEIFRHEAPCIPTKINDTKRLCSLGLIVARREYLGAPNRDEKRSILKSAFENILWLIPEAQYPQFSLA